MTRGSRSGAAPPRRCARRPGRVRAPARSADPSPATTPRRRPGTTRLAVREVRRTALRHARHRGEEASRANARVHRRTRCRDSGTRGASVAPRNGHGRAPPPDRPVRRSPARGPSGRAGATAPDPIRGRCRRPGLDSTSRAWRSLPFALAGVRRVRGLSGRASGRARGASRGARGRGGVAARSGAPGGRRGDGGHGVPVWPGHAKLRARPRVARAAGAQPLSSDPGRATQPGAYGLALFRGRFTGTPNAGLDLADGRARDWRLGWRMTSTLESDANLEINLDATRREPTNYDGPPEHGVVLRSSIRW